MIKFNKKKKKQASADDAEGIQKQGVITEPSTEEEEMQVLRRAETKLG